MSDDEVQAWLRRRAADLEAAAPPLSEDEWRYRTAGPVFPIEGRRPLWIAAAAAVVVAATVVVAQDSNERVDTAATSTATADTSERTGSGNANGSGHPGYSDEGGDESEDGSESSTVEPGPASSTSTSSSTSAPGATSTTYPEEPFPDAFLLPWAVPSEEGHAGVGLDRPALIFGHGVNCVWIARPSGRTTLPTVVDQPPYDMVLFPEGTRATLDPPRIIDKDGNVVWGGPNDGDYSWGEQTHPPPRPESVRNMPDECRTNTDLRSIDVFPRMVE